MSYIKQGIKKNSKIAIEMAKKNKGGWRFPVIYQKEISVPL